MDFSDSTGRRGLRESVVPMINVVFLLLIFFLMTAQITPEPPMQITLPALPDGETAEPREVLFINADGAMIYGNAHGDAVLEALANLPDGAVLSIRADTALDAATLAALLPRLTAAGVRQAVLLAERNK